MFSIRISYGFLCFTLLLVTITAFSDEFDFQEILEREHITHGGCLDPGQTLEKYGLSYELIYTAEVFSNLRGGINTNDATEYRGDVSLFLELDTETAGWWKNGTFFVHLQEEHGRGITNEHVGDFQVLSNIDADDYQQVSELWYAHRFFDDTLSIKLGKMEANADFAYVDYGAEFINSSPGFSPTIPLVTYPDQDWGVVVGITPVDWFSIHTGVYQGRPDGGRSIGNTLDQLVGPMVLVEPAIHYTIANKPGHLRLGGWWNGDRFEAFDRNDLAPGEFGKSYGWYLTWDQTLWKELPDEEDDEQGIGIFGQYGWAPEDRSEAAQYVGGGFQWTGAIPSRDCDICGCGLFWVDFSDEAGFAQSDELAVEGFYRVQVANWMSVKPDLQYIVNPGGVGNENALAAGVRVEITF